MPTGYVPNRPSQFVDDFVQFRIATLSDEMLEAVDRSEKVIYHDRVHCSRLGEYRCHAGQPLNRRLHSLLALCELFDRGQEIGNASFHCVATLQILQVNRETYRGVYSPRERPSQVFNDLRSTPVSTL
jgi:hypothetical protein